MKQHLSWTVVALVVLGLACLTGCTGPKLAQRPLTPEQQQWAESMKQWHPAWEQPYLAPVRYRRQPSQPNWTMPAPDVRDTTDAFEPLPDLAPLQSDDFEGADDNILLVPVDEPSGRTETYEVKKGDTLFSIAADIYDNAGAWRRIFEANDDLLNSPDDLVPGMILKLPPQL